MRSSYAFAMRWLDLPCIIVQHIRYVVSDANIGCAASRCTALTSLNLDNARLQGGVRYLPGSPPPPSLFRLKRNQIRVLVAKSTAGNLTAGTESASNELYCGFDFGLYRAAPCLVRACAPATACPVLTSRILLCARYAVRSTDVA